MIPPKLKKGDRIGIVSPSNPIIKTWEIQFESGIRVLKEDFGFDVLVASNALKNTLGYSWLPTKKDSSPLLYWVVKKIRHYTFLLLFGLFKGKTEDLRVFPKNSHIVLSKNPYEMGFYWIIFLKKCSKGSFPSCNFSGFILKNNVLFMLTINKTSIKCFLPLFC